MRHPTRWTSCVPCRRRWRRWSTTTCERGRGCSSRATTSTASPWGSGPIWSSPPSWPPSSATCPTEVDGAYRGGSRTGAKRQHRDRFDEVLRQARDGDGPARRQRPHHGRMAGSGCCGARCWRWVTGWWPAAPSRIGRWRSNCSPTSSIDRCRPIFPTARAARPTGGTRRCSDGWTRRACSAPPAPLPPLDVFPPSLARGVGMVQTVMQHMGMDGAVRRQRPAGQRHRLHVDPGHGVRGDLAGGGARSIGARPGAGGRGHDAGVQPRAVDRGWGRHGRGRPDEPRRRARPRTGHPGRRRGAIRAVRHPRWRVGGSRPGRRGGSHLV